MNQQPILDYTHKDYTSLREAMLALAREKLDKWTDHSPNDLGMMLLELFAYMGDIMLYYQDRIANESYLDTAVERRSVMHLLRLIGYDLRPPQPASADLSLYFEKLQDNANTEVVIPANSIFATNPQFTPDPVEFRFIKDSITIKLDDLPVVYDDDNKREYYLYEKLPIVQVDLAATREIIGSSDGTPNQRFAIPASPLIPGSLVIHVAENENIIKPWQQHESLLYSLSEDHHYIVRFDENDIAWIEFGDNKYGRIPPRGHNNIFATYLSGGGEKGNVPPHTVDQFPSNIDLLEKIDNKNAASGGTEHEALDIAAQRGPKLYRSMGRAVTTEDYVAHALDFGIGKARARARNWNQIDVYAAPVGGGVLSDTLKEDLRHYLDNKRVISTGVDIKDPDYIKVAINGSLEIEPYYFADQVLQTTANAIAEIFAFENVDFQQKLYISKLYEAVEALEGIISVHISRLQREDQSNQELLLPDDGVIQFNWSEIPYIQPIQWQLDSEANRWNWWTTY